ncbi:MAG: hypothetical protein NTU49_03225, partial [Gammaproteobacteria bacterium]|nr:hypothetical protein [Gammaproteobacteria bacterium]
EKEKIKLLIEKAMFPLTIKNSSKKDKESMEFLRAILAVHEETPSFALSPDYKIDDPNTPTLCFVLTTLEAEKQLQLAVHGSEATLAQPVAGEFPTRVIRALDEQPELSKKHTPAENRKFSAEELHQLKTATDSDVMHAVYSPLYGQKQSRPVQTYHPNFESKIKPHGYDTSNFMLTWHDRFHCWRNGANFKMFIYHERKLFTRKGACQEKNFVMSKALWELTDMDYSHGRQIRLAIKSNDPSRIEKAYFDYVFGVLDKLEISRNSDLHYLHIIDIIKNPDAWKHFLNYPEDDEKEFHEIMENVLTRSSNRVAKIFEATFRNKELIDLVEKNSEKTNESIILRCKLKSIKNSEFLCDAIDSLDIRRFFYWGANSGLIIHESLRLEIKKYCDCDKFNLDEFGAGTLSKVLLICVKQLSESEYKNLLKKIITKRFIREMIEENQFYFLTSLKGSGIELEILENALSGTNTNLFKILYSGPDSLEKIADNITYEIEIAAMLFRLKSEDLPENSVKKIQEKIINNSAITRTILKEIASETRFNSVLLLAFSRNDSVINKAILNNAHCSSELAKRVIIELNNDYFNFNPEELAREKNFIMLSWLALISENDTLLNKILLLTLKAEISEKERTEIQANLIRNKEKGAKYCWILYFSAEKTSDIDTILLKYIKENEKDPEKINDIILFKGGVYLSKPSEKILSELIKKTSAEEALRFLFLEVKRRTKTQNFVMTEEIETAQANFAENPNTPNNILEALAENTKNLTLLVKISERDYSEYPHSILISVAKNSHTSTEILSTLYKKTIDREVLTEIAKNANCDPELKKEIESLNALKARVTHEIQNHIKEISTNQDPCFFKTRNNVSEANRLIKKINCSKNFNELQEQIIIGKAYSEGLELGLSHPPFWKNTYAECLSRCLKIIDKPKAEKALRGK